MTDYLEQTSLFSPFCIYHQINKNTDTYRGYLGNPKKYGDKILKCSKPDRKYGDRFLYGTFYAINPMIRPIPIGIKFLKAIKLSSVPYSTSDVIYSFDPYHVKTSSVDFMTWTRPVAHTVPLYLWKLKHGGNIFPSFESKPPSENDDWVQDIISPVYVLKDDGTFKKDKNGIPMFKFKGIQGRCIPDPNGVSMNECFLLTNVNILEPQNARFNLLNYIAKGDQITLNKPSLLHTFFKKLSPVFITLTISTLIILIFVIFSKTNFLF